MQLLQLLCCFIIFMELILIGQYIQNNFQRDKKAIITYSFSFHCRLNTGKALFGTLSYTESLNIQIKY